MLKILIDRGEQIINEIRSKIFTERYEHLSKVEISASDIINSLVEK